MTGRMKFYTLLMDDLELISADRLQKMPGAYPLKLWVTDRGPALSLRMKIALLNASWYEPCYAKMVPE